MYLLKFTDRLKPFGAAATEGVRARSSGSETESRVQMHFGNMRRLAR